MSNRRKGLLWSGLITGILGAGWLLYFVYWVVFESLHRLPEPIAWFDLIASTLVILGGIFAAWKSGRLGAVILFVATILVSAANSIISIGTEFYEVGIFLFAIPATVFLLVSGLLFLLSERDVQKK